MNKNTLLQKIHSIKVFTKGERRAPHKPLLFLLALGQWQAGKHQVVFGEIEEPLLELLKAYAPPVVSRHQPELPFWHLQTDGLWEVEGGISLPRQAGGFPKVPALRKSMGGFPPEVTGLLESEPGLVDEITDILLNDHFPASLHDDILAATGVTSTQVAEAGTVSYTQKRTRDPAFRDSVLRAYEHKCALTGFRAALGGTYFGCEAAHVMWHAYRGPDRVDNGLCLEPTMHKLFDAGAWALTDDRRVLVSAHLTGDDTTIERLRSYHGKTIREPLGGEPNVAPEYIRWHREADLGGVFRGPGLKA